STMLKRFARTPGRSKTEPRPFWIGHHQPWIFAPESLEKLTGSAFRSAGGFPIRVWTGCASSHPTEIAPTIATTIKVPQTTANRFISVQRGVCLEAVPALTEQEMPLVR